MRAEPARLWWLAVFLTLAFRFWLAATFPFTGDEAYFYWWGRFPDWGFYDHPPMVGWWLAALLAVSDSEVWLRLPQVLQPVLLALAVRWAWPALFPEQSQARESAALLVLLAPVNVWNVFITTDTPLVYFSVASALCWLRAVRTDDLRWYAAAGLLLAGAVLSKYFAALLGFAYLVDVLRRPRAAAWRGLALVYGLCLPALALMAAWNAEHCWVNYLFNFVNRHEAGPGLQWRTPLLYPLMLLYVLTPPVLWALLRRPPAGRTGGVDRSLLILAAVPLLLFALLSLTKTIGLHWVLAFVPLAMLLAVRRLSERGLARLLTLCAALAVLHALVFVLLLRLPLETWRELRLYPGIVLTVEGAALVERAAPGDTLLVSDGYSNAVTLGYQLRRYVPVLGLASSHARHDDILTDWRRYDGADITVLRKTPPRPGEYEAWFARVTHDSFEHRGARFWVVRGAGFDYARYRADVLAAVRTRYYAVPRWLPLRHCYFCARYFPDEPCRR